MFAAAAFTLLVTIAIGLARLFLGPSVFDRVLAANMIGTKMVLLIVVLGYLRGRPDFVDIALAYAMINFTGTMAVLKFFRGRPHPRPYDAGGGIAETRSGIQ